MSLKDLEVSDIICFQESKINLKYANQIKLSNNNRERVKRLVEPIAILLST